MEDYLFQEGAVPFGYDQDFEQSLFNNPAHLALQASTGWSSFYILNKKHHHVSGAVHFHIQDNVARSPLKSPFGSVEFSKNLPPQILFQFIEYFESALKAKGVTEIVLKDSPTDYRADQSALLHAFLFNLDYTVSDAEVGAMIHVSQPTIDVMHDWEKRKLRQAADARLQFRELEIGQLGEIYLFILGCRKQKGYSLSMSLSDLKQVAQTFRRQFHVFGVMRDEKLAAASIAIRVRGNVLYNFYSAHAHEFDALSPVVFLISNMCRYCFKYSIEQLDLGTSALDGKPNFSLLDFKLRLGGKATTKLTFRKLITP